LPSWAIDDELWKRAYGLFLRQYGKKPNSGADFGIITGIYKKLGGRVQKKKEESLDELDSIFNKIKDLAEKDFQEMIFNDLYKEYVK